jgi:ribosomal protein S18 acetylase RimI-like enzyme
MLVRRLQLSDAALVHTFRVGNDADSPGTLGCLRQREQALSLEQIALELSNQQFATYGAFIDSRLVGTASIAPIPFVPSWFGIFAVGVMPEFRGHKISRILVDRCLVFASSENAEGVTLIVNVPNPAAKSLYESFGFEVWNTAESAYVYEGIQYDELSMRKFIKST